MPANSVAETVSSPRLPGSRLLVPRNGEVKDGWYCVTLVIWPCRLYHSGSAGRSGGLAWSGPDAAGSAAAESAGTGSASVGAARTAVKIRPNTKPQGPAPVSGFETFMSLLHGIGLLGAQLQGAPRTGI